MTMGVSARAQMLQFRDQLFDVLDTNGAGTILLSDLTAAHGKSKEASEFLYSALEVDKAGRVERVAWDDFVGDMESCEGVETCKFFLRSILRKAKELAASGKVGYHETARSPSRTRARTPGRRSPPQDLVVAEVH